MDMCELQLFLCANLYLMLVRHNPPSSVWIVGKHCDSASDGGKV